MITWINVRIKEEETNFFDELCLSLLKTMKVSESKKNGLK